MLFSIGVVTFLQKKVQKIKSETDKNIVKNLEDGLYQQGYTKVNYVGRNFEKTNEGKAISNHINSGKTLSTHFRRGHFRNQPYGEKLSQRKIIFIAPTIVNEGGEMQGKIYKL